MYKTAKPQTPTIHNVGHHIPCDPYKIDSGDRQDIGTTYSYLPINEILQSSINRLASFKVPDYLSSAIIVRSIEHSLKQYHAIKHLSYFLAVHWCICSQLLNGR